VPQLQCGDASTFILTVNEGNTKNSRSLVARIEYADFSVTLTGDATRATQRDAVDNFQDIQTTVLTGSHHGAITHGSNNQSWANAVQPSITVFSSGTLFKHPRCRAVEAYHPSLMTVSAHEVWCGEQDGYRAPFSTELAQYVTRINGTVVISSDGENDHRIECTLTSDCGF
jgi:hypothetical protein